MVREQLEPSLGRRRLVGSTCSPAFGAGVSSMLFLGPDSVSARHIELGAGQRPEVVMMTRVMKGTNNTVAVLGPPDLARAVVDRFQDAFGR